jgi:Domain of unknown function (DUF4864)
MGNALRGWLLALVLVPALATAGAWGQAMQPATDLAAADRDAIRTVIGDQMAAFKRDDAAAAFGFAAPNIQDMFGTPEHFLAMVRQGYQPVYRPSDVRFGELVRIDGSLAQLVHVVGPDGVPQLAVYFVERQPDGRWRITGCVLSLEPGTTT